MFRDHFKNEQYFGESAGRLKATLDRVRQELLSKPQPYRNEYYTFADGLSVYISLAYSLGLSVKSLVAPCREMLDAYTNCIDTDTDYSDGGGLIYSQLLSMVAMGVLLDTKAELRNLGNKLARVGYKDYLMNYLLRYADPNYELPETLLWPEDESCRKLMEITKSGKAEAAAGLYEYLQKTYYTRDNLEDDYNAHKRADRSYTGYWSFESAAIAKVMNLDDAKLKGNPYYPYDMLHGDPPGTPERPVEPPPSPDSRKEEPAPVQKKKWWQF
ncbi:PoNe immunity protein domain-containing protein [Chitinophaga sp. 22620]|uniref:PoNe immunity protein domain-containing protein n=1 Tax=Chitinophaga sp. 22620 TaxID=3453952 RepID=UPI003F866798